MSGLTEYEYDTVFTGVYEGKVEFNKQEVENIRWMSKEDLEKEFINKPDDYSFWFKIIFQELKKRALI